MKSTILLLVLALLGGVAARAAAAGEYAGTWTAEGDGGSGTFHLMLTNSDGAWNAKFDFTSEGNAVPATVSSVKVEGSHMVFEISFESDGDQMHARLEGDVKDDEIEGTFATFPPGKTDPAMKGTWKGSRKA